MGYGDNRYGSDEYRNRGASDRRRDGDREGRWQGERSRGSAERGHGGDWDRGRGDEDRGFIERAGDRMRSWFGDDDDDRHGRGYERGRDRGHERGMSGPGRESFGAGFGNQRGWRDERWDRDFGPAEGYEGGAPRGERERSGRGGGSDSWRDQGIGGGSGGSGGYEATMRGAGRRGGAEADRMGGYDGGFSGSYGGVHDPHYAEWRERQMAELDRDYEDFRRENQSRFEQEFGSWREKRQGQRQMMSRVTPQMEVVGSDGEPVGTVDKVGGDKILLTRSDSGSGGIQHAIPCSWVATVDQRVTLTKSAEEVQSHWRTEDQNRALFERPGQGQGGPHVLNRSFSGTYRDEGDDSSR
jgi:hypothetical protein